MDADNSLLSAHRLTTGGFLLFGSLLVSFTLVEDFPRGFFGVFLAIYNIFKLA